MYFLSYLPNDALANTSYSTYLTDTGSIILHHTDDVVALVFRVMLNFGKIVGVADCVKIITHFLISYSNGCLISEVEDVKRLRERLVDEGCKIFLRNPSKNVLSGTDR